MSRKNVILRLGKCLIIVFGLIQCSTLSAEVVIYGVPNEVLSGNKYIYRSKEYTVEIVQSDAYTPFVYSMDAMHKTNVSKTTAWVNFSFSGTIKVRITKLYGNIGFCQVLPASKDIKLFKESNTVEFSLSEAGHYSVEFQKGIVIDHPLLIFANPLEKDVPLITDPNVIRFDDGYHEIGEKYIVPSGKKIYISGGAYIKGQFYAEKGQNISITGRGILSGEDYPARTADHMIVLRNASKTLIEGITIIHAPRYMIAVNGDSSRITNVKMMGWWFSTDGVSSGENSIIEHCFFKVNDDAVKVYSSNMIVRNNVIWQMENGSPFMISWNGSRDFGNCHIINNDIIRVEHQWDNENLAVVCAVHGGKARISGMVFENLRIDNADWRVFHIITKPNRWGRWDPETGSISNFAFKNIRFTGKQKIKSLILGHDAFHPVTDMSFENLIFGGEKISSLQDVFIIDKEFTKNIKLVK